MTQILSVAPLQSYFADVYMAWPLILGMVGVSIAVSLFYSILIRYFAGCMVWTMIFALMVLLLGIGLVTALLPSVKFLQDIFKYDELPDTLKDRNFQIAVSVITLFMFTIGIIIVCCMKRQIAICTHRYTSAIGIIKAAADFVRNCCSAFFIPFYITFFQLLFVVFWVAVLLFLFSSNTGDIDPIDGTPFAMVHWSEDNQWLILYYIFGLLWYLYTHLGSSTFSQESRPSGSVLQQPSGTSRAENLLLQ